MTKFRQQLKSTWLPCLAYGLGVGAFVGVVVVLFKLAAEWIIEKSAHLYQLVRDNPIWAVVLFVALVAIATATYFVQRWCKETKGGGIPRAEGAIKAVLSLRPLRTAVAIVVNSLLAFLAGLPLGSEGPSVLLGTSLGGITGKLSSEDQWNRYAMAGGASAGFAVATCAP
ncbi:MAG: chloride channel protein, partial [Clostridia bacterium]|nr:chloride channel protein [Clostridia bacterium]